MQYVNVSIRDYVAYIELHRPDQLNALNYEMLLELKQVVEDLKNLRQTVRVIVFHGAGRAFSVGADLKERLSLSDEQVKRNVFAIRTLFDAIAKLPQPTIAMMHGYAFGGGLELALACDFRFAERSTKMGLTEVSLGIIPGAGGTQRLPRLVGMKTAKEWILTAKRFTAEEAFAKNLLTDLADNEESLKEKVEDWVSQLLKNAPLALYAAKEAVDHSYDLMLQKGVEKEWLLYEPLIETQDRKEALLAFKEKRKPHFKGE